MKLFAALLGALIVTAVPSCYLVPVIPYWNSAANVPSDHAKNVEARFGDA
jgi:hypothetical protein